MDWSDAALAIRSRINGAWLDTPIEWENESFSPPTDGPWISVSIQRVTEHVHAIQRPGNHRFRVHGIIGLEVMTPVGTGDGDAAALIETFCAIFRLQTFDEIRAFLPDSASSPGPTDDGMWWVTETRIPFYFDTFG